MTKSEKSELIRLCRLAKRELIAARAPKSLIEYVRAMRLVNLFIKDLPADGE
jgi:hypothetical protein